jgi:hypothetical protein
MNARFPGLFLPPLALRDVTPYDCMWIIALALEKLWNSSLPNTGQNLRDAIRSVSFDGIGGHIAFDTAHNGDIFGSHILYNFKGANFEVNNFPAFCLMSLFM